MINGNTASPFPRIDTKSLTSNFWNDSEDETSEAETKQTKKRSADVPPTTALEGAEPAARRQMLDGLARECIVAYYLLTIKAGCCGELKKVDFNNMEPSDCSEDRTAKRDGKVPPGRD